MAGGPLAQAKPRPQQYDNDQQLHDRQFDELCQQYAPSHLRTWAAAAPAVAQKRILEIRLDNGYPEFSDGTSYNGVGVDDATKTASGTDTRMSRRMRKHVARAV
ncbi:hypothetical protein VPH35_131585 [Triticum aestivum]